MAIGGKREGAGRKSAWRSPTKMMRLPAQYEQQLTEYAKVLDSESEPTIPALRDQVQDQVNQLLPTIKLADRAAAKKLFNKLLKRLEPTEPIQPEPIASIELAGHGKDPTRIQPSLPLIAAPAQTLVVSGLPGRRRR